MKTEPGDLGSLNNYLRGKTLNRGGRCYGSIIYFPFEGGAIETAGSDWLLTIDNENCENSDDIRDDTQVSRLIGRAIREISILSPDSCALKFWCGAVLTCWNAAREDYAMGREMLNVFRDDPNGDKWICEFHAPLGRIVWEDPRGLLVGGDRD